MRFLIKQQLHTYNLYNKIVSPAFLKIKNTSGISLFRGSLFPLRILHVCIIKTVSQIIKFM